MRKFFIVLLLLIGFLIWGAWAIADFDGNGCTHGSETCGDPSWQNYPPY